MNEYQMAIKIMAENDKLCDFVGEIDDDIIKKAEKTLGTIFPESYRVFISAFGAGNYGSQEIYGIIKGDFINSGVPDAIWLTLKEREENNLPKELIIIYYTGDEFYYCLNTKKAVNGDCPVEAVDVGDLTSEREVIYSSFSEFLLDIVKEETE